MHIVKYLGPHLTNAYTGFLLTVTYGIGVLQNEAPQASRYSRVMHSIAAPQPLMLEACK